MTPSQYLLGMMIGFAILILIGLCAPKEKLQQVVSYDNDTADAIDCLTSMGYAKEDAEMRVSKAKATKPSTYDELVNRAVRAYESNNH